MSISNKNKRITKKTKKLSPGNNFLIKLPNRDVPISKDHSMNFAFPFYCLGKVPFNILESIYNNQKIYLLGTLEEDLKKSCSLLQITNLKLIAEMHKNYKKFYTLRPVYYQGIRNKKKVLVCMVFPAPSYIYHYMGIIKTSLDIMNYKNKQDLIISYINKDIYQNIDKYINLKIIDKKIQDKFELVCLGYVSDIENRIKRISNEFILLEKFKEKYFGFSIYNYKGKKILFIGFVATFWGEMAKKIGEFFGPRCKEILYFGKCGLLQSNAEPYKWFTCPTEFYLSDYPMNDRENVKKIKQPKMVFNKIIQENKTLLKKYNINIINNKHITVPTVTYQSLNKITKYVNLGVSSIDNEISSFAEQCYNNNIIFSSFHITTDKPRHKKNKMEEVKHDLAKMSLGKTSKEVISNAKDVSLKLICNYILYGSEKFIKKTLDSYEKKEKSIFINQDLMKKLIDFNIPKINISLGNNVDIYSDCNLWKENLIPDINYSIKKNILEKKYYKSFNSGENFFFGGNNFENKLNKDGNYMIMLIPSVFYSIQKNQIINFDIYGTGSICKDFYKNSLFFNTSLKKIYSNSGREKQFLSEIKHQLFSCNYREKSKFIYIGTKTEDHYINCKKFLSKKMNTLCEKPITRNIEETIALFSLSIKNNVILMENLYTMFSPFQDFIRANIKKIGNINLVNIRMYLPKKYIKFSQNLKSSNIFSALGSYTIYILSLLINLNSIDYQKLSIKCTRNRNNFIEEVKICYDNKINLYHSFQNEGIREIYIEGENGFISADEPHFPEKNACILKNKKNILLDINVNQKSDTRRTPLSVSLYYFLKKINNPPSLDLEAINNYKNYNTKNLDARKNNLDYVILSLSIQNIFCLISSKIN